MYKELPMASSSIRSSAPGKLMLLGEHAVLRGHRCMVCAVDRRMTVTLRPRADDRISITSGLGAYSGSRQVLEDDDRFCFLLAVLRSYREQLPGGCDIDVQSEFPEITGLGSSAAVTVAATAAVRTWCALPHELNLIFTDSLACIREVQKTGSGADAAASTFGGLLTYFAGSADVAVAPVNLPIEVVYSGMKAHTTEVVKEIEARRTASAAAVDQIFQEMDVSCERALAAVTARDWTQLGEIMNRNQDLMGQLGLSDSHLDSIIDDLRGDSGIFGAKLSGAGKGDCIIAIGNIQDDDFPHARLGLRISKQGVTVD
jgi:mevalonate kinase